MLSLTNKRFYIGLFDCLYMFRFQLSSIFSFVESSLKGKLAVPINEDFIIGLGSILTFLKMRKLDQITSYGERYIWELPSDVRNLFERHELEQMIHQMREFNGHIPELLYGGSMSSYFDKFVSPYMSGHGRIPADIEEKISDVFEEVLKVYCNSQGKTNVFFPQELVDVVHEILDREGINEIYDPFAGIGSLGLDARFKFSGQEANPVHVLIAKIRFYLKGNRNSEVLRRDSIQEYWDFRNQRHRSIVTILPMGKIPETQYANYMCKSIEDYFLTLSRNEETLHSNGVVMVVLPTTFLYAIKSQSMVRSRLAISNCVDAIISLPNWTPGMTTNMSLLIIKQTRQSDTVRMINATNMVRSDGENQRLDSRAILDALYGRESENTIDVPLGQILAENSLMYPMSYLINFDIVVGEGPMVLKFDELVESRTSLVHTECMGRLFHISDQADPLTVIDSQSDLVEEQIKTHCTKVEETVLVLNKVGRCLPTIVKASPECPVYVQSHMAVYKVKTELVDEEYLAYHIYKAYQSFIDELSVKSAFSSTGSLTTPLISSFFKNLKIAVPETISQQRVIIDNIKQERAIAKVRELHLEGVIEKMKASYMNQVRTIRHDIRPYLRQLSSIKKLASKKISNFNSLDITDAHYSGSKTVFVTELNRLMIKYEEALSSISDLVELLVQEDAFGEKEKFNIDRFFHCLQGKKTIGDVNYTVKYQCDCASLLRSHVLNPKMYEADVDELPEDIELDEFCDFLSVEGGLLSPIDFKWRFNELHKDFDGAQLYSEEELAIEKELIQRHIESPETPIVPSIGTVNEIWKPVNIQESFVNDFNKSLVFYDVFAQISRNDFERMVQNIINNAVDHGFTSESSENEICIKLSVDLQKEMYVIDFINNGNPFPAGLTKERYGINLAKEGPTAKTGHGGYLVKTISEHFGGGYDLLTIDGQPTVRIYLPIVRYLDC